MTSHELSALVGAYAIDALDGPERELFEAHLADCADCAAEVASLRAAAAELSHTSATPPPAELRAELLAAVSRVRPLPPRGTVIELGQRLPRRRMWPAIAAACALIAVGAAGWGVQEHQQLTGGHRVSVGALGGVLDSRDVSTASVPVGSTGQATLIYSKDKREVVLIGKHIPAPPDGKTYQLWMLGPGDSATSGGLFRPNADGAVLVEASGDLAATDRMGISVEQAGGAEQPTPGAIVADVSI